MEIILIGILALGAIALWLNAQGVFDNKKRKKPTNTPLAEKQNEEKMVEIDDFDKDKHLDDVFSSVFYSIMNEEGWSIEYKYHEILFKKESRQDKYHTVSVEVSFNYSFERSDNDYTSPRIFTIKGINIRSGYENFTYKSNPSKELISFIYSKYSGWMNESNERQKERADSSLKSIKSVIGKSSERGAKIDEILGD